MRVCLVYDCLFPHTVGGAERWYRSLGERLAAEGHEVTYLTLRQWDRGSEPDVAGVRVRVVGPRMRLYVDGPSGRRRILPPLAFGLGVLWHLLRHGRRYDVVHTASFPYFSLLAAAAVRPLHRFGLVVDWHELWTRSYWHEYLGGVGGRVGWAVQRRCLRVPQRAFCFARMTAARLREAGLRGDPTVLTGEYAGSLARPDPAPAEPLVAFAGRHIPEKRVPALVRAFARAREQAPELRLVVLGDGPERPAVLRAIEQERIGAVAEAPGFVAAEEVERTLARALCMVLPSRREGYGMVVVEAAARGVPSVVVDAPDNAAVELVDDGENGFVAASAEPDELAAAILRVRDAGPALRTATADWFARNARRLSLDGSLDRVAEAYRDWHAGAGPDGPPAGAPPPGGGGADPYTSRA
jgi:glycosyltransferase involved in cell wall biosynthesis